MHVKTNKLGYMIEIFFYPNLAEPIFSLSQTSPTSLACRENS